MTATHTPGKKSEILFEMFLAYVATDDFGSLTNEERREVVKEVDDMKEFLLTENKA
jgi:hypothetical protein